MNLKGYLCTFLLINLITISILTIPLNASADPDQEDIFLGGSKTLPIEEVTSGKKGTLSAGLISCPRCGQQFEPDASRAPYVQCPYCGTSGMLK